MIDLRSRLDRVVGARGATEAARLTRATDADPSRTPATQHVPFSVHEERIALVDLGLELIGRGAPDPRTLAHLGLRGPAPARWEDVLFLDTETTGLSGGTGTYVFLLGTARIEDGSTLVLRQHLLHDLAAERSFVAALALELAPYRACASYNGKCFDLPLLRTRFVLARGGAELAVDESHLDLLHPARRLWRGRFGSVTLRQLEDSVLDDARENDISGALIPERFFAWLRSGDDALIAPVLTHNARDIVSLVRIADRIAAAITRARAGMAPDHAPAALALARAFERTGDVEAAFGCWESAYLAGDLATRQRAALPYARAIERRGDNDRAARLILTLLDLGQGTPQWRAQAEARLRRLERLRRRANRASVPRPRPSRARPRAEAS